MSPLTGMPSASESTAEPEPTVTSVTEVATDSGTPDPTVTSTTSEASGPQFISLQTSSAKITAGEVVTITAVLTDPDGVADILGGTLSSADGQIGYGPFAGQGGSYSIDLSWNALQQAESITFVGMDLTRTFRAEFVDQAAHSAVKTIDVSLTCATGSACDGLCVDTATDATNCGTCGKTCEGGCESGACTPDWDECIDKNSGFASCDEYCTSVGEKCVADGCGTGQTIYGFQDSVDCQNEILGLPAAEPCDVVQPWSVGRTVIRCCCSDGG